MVSDTELSRAVSHALRHQPWLYEIELDDEGWTPVDQLLSALNSRGGRWADVDRAALERMIATATKQRHELDGDRIRALYGHSLTGLIRKAPATPPARLFHGTAPQTWRIVAEQGLRPMRRQYVHLSVDTGTAKSVGRRKSGDPVILVIDTAAATAAGTTFYAGNDLVWLADTVAPEAITVLDRNDS